MSKPITRSLAWYAAVGMLTLAGAAGCAGTTTNGGQPLGPPTGLESPPALDSTSEPGTPTAPAGPATTKATAASSWPSPEDCISYNPQNVTVHYEGGIYSVNDGSKVVMRLHGGPGELVGEQGLALAKRYSKHCFIGRNNTREDKNSYIFDYWRGASGMTPTIPDEEEVCSDYNRGNLTVENMGDGYGWRVKDHDHVLHVFDNESDARNGKLVLAKYNKICFLGNEGDGDDLDLVSYLR